MKDFNEYFQEIPELETDQHVIGAFCREDMDEHARYRGK